MTEEEKSKIPLERERKFLVNKLPENLESYTHKKISQGYISIAEDGTEVRLRKKFQELTLTIKSAGGKTRPEVEMPITKQKFKELWHLTEGKRIHKTRYEIPLGNLTIELDIYHGNLNGLITAEVEFTSEEKSNQFIAPEWFSKEVTGFSKYKNQNLARYGLPDKTNLVLK
jgi:CYTH domain-containing protein